MNEIIYRSLENPRVTMMPLEVTAAEAGTCPHKQRGTKNMENEIGIIPDIVVRKDELGHIVGDANKRRELVDKFEKEHGLDDIAYPLDGNLPEVRVMTDSTGAVRQIIAERPITKEEMERRSTADKPPLRVRTNARGEIWQEPEDRPW